MTDDRLERAIGLVQSGKRESARELLELILKEDRHSIPVWHWYAQTWPNDADKIRVWEICLRYNPENQLAQEALRDLIFIPSKPISTETKNPAPQVSKRGTSSLSSCPKSRGNCMCPWNSASTSMGRCCRFTT